MRRRLWGWEMHGWHCIAGMVWHGMAYSFSRVTAFSARGIEAQGTAFWAWPWNDDYYSAQSADG